MSSYAPFIYPFAIKPIILYLNKDAGAHFHAQTEPEDLSQTGDGRTLRWQASIANCSYKWWKGSVNSNYSAPLDIHVTRWLLGSLFLQSSYNNYIQLIIKTALGFVLTIIYNRCKTLANDYSGIPL